MAEFSVIKTHVSLWPEPATPERITLSMLEAAVEMRAHAERHSYPVEILTQFAAFYDFSAATAAAIPMLIITVMILVLEIRLLHTSVLELSAATFGGGNAPIALGRWRFPLFGLALVWTLVTVALSLAVLIVLSASLGAFADAFSRASDSILRSVVFAAIGATLWLKAAIEYKHEWEQELARRANMISWDRSGIATSSP